LDDDDGHRFPVSVMAALLRFDVASVNSMAKAWFWSKDEATLAAFLCRWLDTTNPNTILLPTLDQCRQLLRPFDHLQPDPLPIAYLKRLFVLQGRLNELRKLPALVPKKFPITNSILRAEATSAGKADMFPLDSSAATDALKALRKSWVASNCLATKDQLLSKLLSSSQDSPFLTETTESNKTKVSTDQAASCKSMLVYPVMLDELTQPLAQFRRVST